MAEAQFVNKDAFDIQIKSIRDRQESDEKISDIRFDYMRDMMNEQFKRLEAVVEKNLAKHEAIAYSIKGDMKTMDERMEKRFAQYETVISGIKGDVKALAACVDAQQIKFGWYLAIFGAVIAAIQLLK